MISVYPERCTACRLCELACSFKKTGEFNPTSSRVRVSIFADEFFQTPIVCAQCDEAWCMKACPSGAISRDYGGRVVKVDWEKCVGCCMCTLACPFGSIAYFAPELKAIKCDECDGQPECVLFCPTGALKYEEEAAPARLKRMRTAKRLGSCSGEIQS
jgi:anaerobic carbon-monoxide dehydrogenase iron sulfur subunit